MTVGVDYKIFHYPIPVYLPNHLLYSKQHMENIPGFASGDEQQDREFMKRKTVQYRTADKIALLHQEGYDPQFTKMGDLVNVYDWVVEHLKYWADQIKTPFGRKPPPEEDLMAFDAFAQHLNFLAGEYIRRHRLITAKPIPATNGAITIEEFSRIFGYVGPITETPVGEDGTIDPDLIYESPILDAWESSPWSQFNEQ